jgi:hypothetical protein
MKNEIRILGRRWFLNFTENLNDRGDCDHPSVYFKQIRINRDLSPSESLEVLIHEFLHAANWYASEDWVTRTAFDLTRVLERVYGSDAFAERCWPTDETDNHETTAALVEEETGPTGSPKQGPAS